jgi:hypothetical protein
MNILGTRGQQVQQRRVQLVARGSGSVSWIAVFASVSLQPERELSLTDHAITAPTTTTRPPSGASGRPLC